MYTVLLYRTFKTIIKNKNLLAQRSLSYWGFFFPFFWLFVFGGSFCFVFEDVAILEKITVLIKK